MTWDDRFIGLAEYVSSWSKDPSSKVGACIIGDRRRVVSLGFNGFPRGIKDDVERLNDRAVKYRLVSHAERNALDNAETSVVGATIYVTRHPCSECAKSIVQRGIVRVVYQPHADFDARWAEDLAWAKEILAEGGVSLEVAPCA